MELHLLNLKIFLYGEIKLRVLYEIQIQLRLNNFINISSKDRFQLWS